MVFDGASYRLEIRGRAAADFPIGSVVVSDRVGNIPRSFAFPGGARFVTPENETVDAWLGDRSASGIVARLERSGRTAAAAAVSLLAILVFVYFVVLPRAAEGVARMLPDRVAREVSRGVLLWIDRTIGARESKLAAADNEKASRAFARVRKAQPGLPLTFRIVHVDGMPGNAFALPDGTVLVIDSLVPLLTEDEIVAVLFHESGHVAERHGLSLVVETSFLSLIVFTIAGGDGTSVPLVLMNAAYSRRHEAAADAFAKHRLLELGMKPALLASALEKLTKAAGSEKSVIAFLSSHPLTEDRRKALEAP